MLPAARLMLALLLPLLATPLVLVQEAKLKVLFLGDNGHHKPAECFRQIEPVLAARGIDVQYTDAMASLNAETIRPSYFLSVSALSEAMASVYCTSMPRAASTGSIGEVLGGFCDGHCRRGTAP